MAVPTFHYAHNAISRGNFPSALPPFFLIAPQEGRNLGRINYHFAHNHPAGRGTMVLTRWRKSLPLLLGPREGKGIDFHFQCPYNNILCKKGDESITCHSPTAARQGGTLMAWLNVCLLIVPCPSPSALFYLLSILPPYFSDKGRDKLLR